MRKTMHALGSKWSCSTRKSSIFGIKLSHSTVVKNPLFDLFDHRQPKLHLWDDHNSNGEIIGVCIYIYIYIYIYIRWNQILTKNTSPYLHSASLDIWALTSLKGIHLGSSLYRGFLRTKAAHSISGTPDPRREKSKLKMTGWPQTQRRIQAHIL